MQELLCPNQQAACTLVYDGQQDGIFPFSRQSCVALRLLYRYIDQLVTLGMTIDGYVRSLQIDYERYCPGPSIPFMSIPQFRKVYYAFGSRLKQIWCFMCPTCQDHPDILVGDATSATMQKRFYEGSPLTAWDTSLPVHARPHTRQQRCFAGDEIRRLLQSAAAMLSGESPDPECLTALTDDCASLHNDENFQISPFILYIAGNASILSEHDRKAVSTCLKDLASDSPVCAYVPVDVIAICKRMLERSSNARSFLEQDADVFGTSAPLLAGMLRAMHDGQLHGTNLQPSCVSLIAHLVRRASLCVSGGNIAPMHVPLAAPSCLSDACLKSGTCSGLAIVRGRPQYTLDQAKDVTACRHSFDKGSGGSHRTGGIFTWFCKHMVCYAFFLIPGAEGRDEAFSFLTTHFKEAPKVVVYDFACALQDYCLNREPGFFRDTRFVVDRFHWFNHQACARSYNADLYADVAFLNTQIAEQCNSALAKIKASVGQMTQAHFMFTVRLFLNHWNKRKIDLVHLYQQE